jgi:hypothetical protein
VEQLVDTVNAIKADPTLARFQFRAETEWVDGGHSRTKIQRFHGAGQEDASRATPFILEGDEPPVTSTCTRSWGSPTPSGQATRTSR